MAKISISNLFTSCFSLIIRLYRYGLSPLLGDCCRFYPSCSSYALEAIKTHRLPYACFLILHRVFRCHPWCQGGVDLVPGNKIYANKHD